MEIKEAIKEIREGDSKTTSPQRGVAILTICQALCDGYTLCKADEAIKGMKQRKCDMSHGEFVMFNKAIDECIRELKEACL